MLTNGTYFLLLQQGEIRGDVVPARVSPGTAKSFSSPWLGLVFGDAKKWLGLGIAGGRQEEAEGVGQPKSAEVLGNEAL